MTSKIIKMSVYTNFSLAFAHAQSSESNLFLSYDRHNFNSATFIKKESDRVIKQVTSTIQSKYNKLALKKRKNPSIKKLRSERVSEENACGAYPSDGSTSATSEVTTNGFSSFIMAPGLVEVRFTHLYLWETERNYQNELVKQVVIYTMHTKKKNWTTHLKPKSERKDSHATRGKKQNTNTVDWNDTNTSITTET